MLIIGCDYHPSFQQIAFVDTDTGECGERRLDHMEGAEQFYRDLRARGREARIGIEASGYSRWFERLMSELGFELWIGDAAAISTKRVRKHKTDKQDAELLLTLLMENRFPRIWVPSREDRDLRQLLWHRHRLVQMQTRLRNQLHAVAISQQPILDVNGTSALQNNDEERGRGFACSPQPICGYLGENLIT